MKTGLFLGAVMLYLMALFAVMPAQAEMIWCNSMAVTIEECHVFSDN